jgi:hypothetical protein
MSDLEPTVITQQVATATEQGKNLHALVRDITLRALSRRALSMSEMMEVVRAVTEGVTLGLGRRAGEIKDAVREALSGLDDALKKTAEATKLAGQQLLTQGKDFGAQDLKPAMDDLKQMEEMFLNTVAKVAESAGGRIKEEFASQLSHARLSGTDSGRMIAETLAEFSQRTSAALLTGTQQTASATLEIKQRLTLLASGILAGMADALHDKAKPGDQKAP